jgi:hypothetical protein
LIQDRRLASSATTLATASTATTPTAAIVCAGGSACRPGSAGSLARSYRHGTIGAVEVRLILFVDLF